MVAEDLGEATIAYEDPDEGTVERTVQNEHVAYFQDHWILKTGENERGEDMVRRIPVQRVHYVERSVEQFEQEVSTLRDQVQSFADDLRSRLLGGDGGTGRGGETRDEREKAEVYHIDVESGEAEETGTTPGDSTGTGASESGESGGTGQSGGTGTAGADETDELTGAETDDDEMSDGGMRGDESEESGSSGR